MTRKNGSHCQCLLWKRQERMVGELVEAKEAKEAKAEVLVVLCQGSIKGSSLQGT